MKTADLRRAFLDYFISKSHREVASSSLIPAGDPTLLFANAGMVQFKDCFLGSDKRDYQRATTCQKCLRISGKHNDLENVGRTARHHTFFEMLGNFSFGDYFKRDAILFGWEFLTQTLKLPKDRLWVTIFENDDEAAELWKKETDVLPGRILRCGEKDNFWAMGETGPCGPCSEIHYYLGDNVKGQSEEEFRTTDGRYMEIWNLVFMQFNRDPSGTLSPLPKPSVDTGMGLERLASIVQGTRANFEIDLIRKLISVGEKLSGKRYDGSDYSERDPERDPQYAIDVALRVIADHARASSFLIADGVNPASDGRGYVLRRLIRRACRHARVLGLKEPFLNVVADEVIATMGDTYPELRETKNQIKTVIKSEEEKFLVTLDTGLSILTKNVSTLKDKGSRSLGGDVAFLLHDTYGFPLDMTQDILRSQGLGVDEEGFARSMDEQRARSRGARAAEQKQILQRAVKPLPSEFVGRDNDVYESIIVGLFTANGEVDRARVGDRVAVVVIKTPFYAEAGGQLGDTGTITSPNLIFDVSDTQKLGTTIVHVGEVLEGEIYKGGGVRLEIESARRSRLCVNHSATHLIHLALREVLGPQVKQAGSRVSDQTLRFDYTYALSITDVQLEEIGLIANQVVQENHQVVTDLMSLDAAKRSGAIALFDEKYGFDVRVVQIGPRSRELCGGTHAKRSGDIGFISIFSEGGISAGVRRIEAYAGSGAVRDLLAKQKLLSQLGTALKSSERDIVDRVARMIERNRELEREIDRLNSQAQMRQSGDLSGQATVLKDGRKVLASVIEKATPKQLREVADDLKERLGTACIALATVHEGRAVVLTAVTDNLTSRYNAGKLLQEINQVIGSKGGGRADLAQAGGGDPEKLQAALARFKEITA